MRNQVCQRQSDSFCSLQEIKSRRIIPQRIYPGTDQRNFFGTQIEVRINRRIAADY